MVISNQPLCEEEGILEEAIIDLVVYLLPQMIRDVRIRRCHAG
jgi:hypothetical protein